MSDTLDTLDLIILGGGISGLSCGYQANKRGLNFEILEKSAKIGGVMQSYSRDGLIIEKGPNSLILTPEIQSLIDDLALENDILRADSTSGIRQILWADQLHTLKPSPITLITTSLLSLKAKIALITELWNKSKSPEGESVLEFFERRFGSEISRRIAGAMVSGIYAGDPDQLEVSSVFPRLIQLESEYTSVIKGLKNSKGPKREIITFKTGVSTLTKALETRIKPHITTDAHVTNIIKKNDRWHISYTRDGETKQISATNLISTVPAYAIKPLLNTLTIPAITDIVYNPMLAIQVQIPIRVLEKHLQGFGFLASPYERKDFIGVMYNGLIFKNSRNENYGICNFFIRPNHTDESDPKEILETLCAPLFKKWTGIQETPIYLSHHLWENAIPQKNTGHQKNLKDLEKWELSHPGIHLAGNYRYGVSIGDCITDHQSLIDRIKETITR